jgi:cell division protein FtsB
MLMGIVSARRFWLPVLVATLVAAVFGVMLGRGARQGRRMLTARAELEGELAQLTRENERLRAERVELLCSLWAVERAAREDLGLVAPGEDPAAEAMPPTDQPHAAPVAVSPVAAALMADDLGTVVPALVFAFGGILFMLWNAVAALAVRCPARQRRRADADDLREV